MNTNRITVRKYKEIIDTPNKPIIPNIEFKNLCERLRNDDVSTMEDILSRYSLESDQKRIIQSEINELNKRQWQAVENYWQVKL